MIFTNSQKVTWIWDNVRCFKEKETFKLQRFKNIYPIQSFFAMETFRFRPCVTKQNIIRGAFKRLRTKHPLHCLDNDLTSKENLSLAEFLFLIPLFFFFCPSKKINKSCFSFNFSASVIYNKTGHSNSNNNNNDIMDQLSNTL